VKQHIRSLEEYLFIVPAAIFLLLFIVFPIIFNIRISFQDLKAANLLSGDAPWVGVDNYLKILRDPVVQKAVIHSVYFTIFSVIFQSSAGLALALFYNQDFPGSRWMRGLYLLGWTMPLMVVAAIFKWLFEGQFGVVNWLLTTTGLISENINWLADIDVVLNTVVIINIWLGIPFNMALLLAGLQGIPKDVYEAARVDGAGKLYQFFYITLPLLRPALFAVLLLGLIYTLRVFDLVWATTQGGPFNASHVISTIAYRRIFEQFAFGEGAAILNLLFVVLLGISLLYIRNINREEAL
jgi:multiple sugar transport system permease protein